MQGRASSEPRVALLDHYSGSNLGDAAIIDATITQIRARLPRVRLSGVSLNNENMQVRHGIPGIALCATPLPYYKMSGRSSPQDGVTGSRSNEAPGPVRAAMLVVKDVVKRSAPRLWRACRSVHFVMTSIPGEIRHVAQAYAHLRSCDLLVIAGGGQLDDEWGGAWGHPYALLKWTAVSRLAGTPVAVLSVGVCKLSSFVSRLFISAALRLACYRSFRDAHSRDLARDLVEAVRDDAIVPDLALALRPSGVDPSTPRVPGAGRSMTIAVSPIAFARADAWPSGDPSVHERYVRVMASLVSQLLERGARLRFVYSSLGTDQMTLTEILGQLDDVARGRLEGQSTVAAIAGWQDFVAAVSGVDCVIASRLHSAILSYLVTRPVIAVSFDPKVNWLLEDFDCQEALLDIHDFTAGAVLSTLDQLAAAQPGVSRRLAEAVSRAYAMHALQFDRLVALTNRSNRARALPAVSAPAKG